MTSIATKKDQGLEEYLNEKLQTPSDFDTLTGLIVSVESRQKQLEEQLEYAQSILSDTESASIKQASEILKKTKEFEKQHASVQKRLMAVTSSETPELAMSRLKRPMCKLRNLELAHSYIDLLNEIESLKDGTRRYLPKNPELALSSYLQLKEIATQLESSQVSIGGATIHLNTFIKNSIIEIWDEMQRTMCNDFEESLNRSNWLDPDCTVSQEWSGSFKRLLDFQSQEIMNTKKTLILLPLKVMTKNLVLQFQYHFSGDKPTNHPHKLGQYFFEWFLGTVAKWEGFLLKNLRPILATHFKDSPLAGNALYVDPIAAFINCLFPLLQDKVDSLIKQIHTQPLLLCQFMIQLIDFEESMKSRFKFDISDYELERKSLTTHVLDTYFDSWFDAEKNLALDHYRGIIQAKGSGEIDYDTSSLGKTKTTFGATQITDLIVNVTFKYHRLQKLWHKINFFIGIQTEILNLYAARLNDALEFYQTANSTIGRTIHGVTREELEELQGTKGLDKLCRVFGSSDHLISLLKNWANDEFFIVLYDQLQREVATVEPGTKVVGDMSVSLVREYTSSSIGSESDGSLFDTTIEAFERLRNRSESLISQAIKYDLPNEFRPYITKTQWTTIGETTSLELDHPLHILQNYMYFLHRVLADAPFRRIFREVLKTLEELLFNEVLMRQDFTLLGSIRFCQDVTSIQSLINRSMPPKSPTPLDMPRLREGSVLLSLPDTAEGGKESYWDVSRAVFSSNQEATRVLARLGKAHLSNADARIILSRRIAENCVAENIFEE